MNTYTNLRRAEAEVELRQALEQQKLNLVKPNHMDRFNPVWEKVGIKSSPVLGSWLTLEEWNTLVESVPNMVNSQIETLLNKLSGTTTALTYKVIEE